LLFRIEWLRTTFSARAPEEQFHALSVQERGMEPTLKVGDIILIDRTMSTEQFDWLRLFADQASVAIANARAFN
jgi:hypothetical protein